MSKREPSNWKINASRIDELLANLERLTGDKYMPEKTCHASYRPSMSMEGILNFRCESCGHYWMGGFDECNYCPSCGAKVTE